MLDGMLVYDIYISIRVYAEMSSHHVSSRVTQQPVCFHVTKVHNNNGIFVDPSHPPDKLQLSIMIPKA